MKNDPIPEATKVKHSTRGTNKAFIVMRSNSSLSSERRVLDQGPLEAIWQIKGIEKPQKDFFDQLKDYVEGALAGLNGTTYYSAQSELGKNIERARKSALKFLKNLEDLESGEGGRTIVDGLAQLSAHFSPDEFRDVIRQAFRTGNPSDFSKSFIRRVHALFEEHGQNVAIHENSLFVLTLKEINEQFPGVSRELDSGSATWRNRVEIAIAGKRKK